jgi:hypothetical protein
MHSTVTPENQALNTLRHKAYITLSRTRSLKAAGMSVVHHGDTAQLMFEDAPILALNKGHGIEQVGRGLIAAIHEWGRAVLHATKAILEAEIKVPEGHELFELAWHMSGDCSLSRSVSLYIRHKDRDMYAPDQFGLEFRLFPNECRAHLFMSYGPQYAFKATNLLSGNEPFVYAGTPAHMARELAARFNIGMQRFEDLKARAQAA